MEGENLYSLPSKYLTCDEGNNMEKEMILKVSFCSKSWVENNLDMDRLSDIESEKLSTFDRGEPCIISVDNYPNIEVVGTFPDCSEISLSDDIYPNIVEMASIMKNIDDIQEEVTVSFGGVEPSEGIKVAVLDVLKLLMPRYSYSLSED